MLGILGREMKARTIASLPGKIIITVEEPKETRFERSRDLFIMQKLSFISRNNEESKKYCIHSAPELFHRPWRRSTGRPSSSSRRSP